MNTLYSQIKSIKSRSVNHISNGKLIYSKLFWKFPVPQSNNLNVDNVKNLIIKNFNEATISDVPIAILLSSGIDSNSILSCLHKSRKTTL